MCLFFVSNIRYIMENEPKRLSSYFVRILLGSHKARVHPLLLRCSYKGSCPVLFPGNVPPT